MVRGPAFERDVYPGGAIVFDDGAPGIVGEDTSGWDYHARVRLR